MFSDPCRGSHISNRAGIKTFGGIFFASDFVKVDIPDVFALDCRSMYKSTICDSSPLPQNAGIVFSNPCSVDTAVPNNSGKYYKTLSNWELVYTHRNPVREESKHTEKLFVGRME